MSVLYGGGGVLDGGVCVRRCFGRRCFCTPSVFWAAVFSGGTDPVAATHKEEGYTTIVLDLKSQVWHSPDEVSRTQWEHWVTIRQTRSGHE